MEEILYQKFEELERKHWWFVSRRKIILSMIGHFVGLGGESKILDIGCGTGMILSHLSEIGGVWGIDRSEKSLSLCREKSPQATLILGKFPELELKENFDLIVCLDVLEHIEDDDLALQKMFALANGRILVTVPAFSFLWTGYDRINHHFRRYSKKELVNKVQKAGFNIEKVTFFNSILFLPSLIAKRAAKSMDSEQQLYFGFKPDWLNRFLALVFSFEAVLLSKLNLPFGTSLLIIAKKT